jgi:hypothetical protein
VRRTGLERAVDAMEAAGWRWAGMSPKAVFFDKKTRDPRTGKSTLEWREFKSPGEIWDFLAGKKRRRAKKTAKGKAE